MFQTYKQVKEGQRKDISFNDWWTKEVLPLNSSLTYKEELKVVWEAAQVEKYAQVQAKFDEVQERAKMLECENESLRRQLSA
jgi:hypothetical protein